jgi:DNA-binding protein HU-beta
MAEKAPKIDIFRVLGLAGTPLVGIFVFTNTNSGASGSSWWNEKRKGPLTMATATKTTVPTVPLSKVAAELAEKTGMTKKDATSALDDFVGLIVKHLKKGNKVRITGLGILQVRNRPARMGRNPATGEAIKIKASKKVAFRVAKDLKESI